MRGQLIALGTNLPTVTFAKLLASFFFLFLNISILKKWKFGTLQSKVPATSRHLGSPQEFLENKSDE